MKILFVTQHMELGGICKSLLNLLWILKDKDLSVDLLVLTGDENHIRKMTENLNINNCFVCRNTHIFYRSYRQQNNIYDALKKISWLFKIKVIGREAVVRQIIACERNYESYDVAISYSNGIWTNDCREFMGGSEYLVLDRVQAKRKIAWIHSEPRKLGITKDICLRLYSKFDKIVDVSKGCKKILDEISPEIKSKSVVFYNLCNAENIRKNANLGNPYSDNINKFKIVTVCRIENVSKRIDRAIECAIRLREQVGSNFIWTVVGDGPDRGNLQKLVDANDLKPVFKFVGRKENPYPYVKNADLYVLTSDYEAFPLTVKEALLLGVPAVITPIPPSQELIDNGRNGYIVDFDSKCISEKITYIMGNSDELNRLRKNLENEQESESYESFIELIS